MRRFDTKQQRLRLLIVLFVHAFTGLRLFNWWGTTAADDEAARRTREIQVALQGHTPIDLQPALLASAYDAKARGMPGGPYGTVSPAASTSTWPRTAGWRCARPRALARPELAAVNPCIRGQLQQVREQRLGGHLGAAAGAGGSGGDGLTDRQVFRCLGELGRDRSL